MTFNYRPFVEARVFAQGLGLKSTAEWYLFCKGELTTADPLISFYPKIITPKLSVRLEPLAYKKPDDIPTYPHLVYKNEGWKGFGDWLGTGNVCAKSHLPFEEARKFTRTLGIKSSTEWYLYCSDTRNKNSLDRPLPDNIPRRPDKKYENHGWVSWRDWLGHNGNEDLYRSFEEAREFARSLGLKKCQQWFDYCSDVAHNIGTESKLPIDIPRQPQKFYKKRGWVDWSDWLGYGNIKSDYRPFEEARKFARGLGLKNAMEWDCYCSGILKARNVNCKLPEDIPVKPSKKYKKQGWVSWKDWLGVKDKT